MKAMAKFLSHVLRNFIEESVSRFHHHASLSDS